jgi:hypothetical protein
MRTNANLDRSFCFLQLVRVYGKSQQTTVATDERPSHSRTALVEHEPCRVRIVCTNEKIIDKTK